MLLGLTNLFAPLALEIHRIGMFFLLVIGFFSGTIGFSAVWLSNFTASKFLRLIKLCLGFYFMVLILAYFIFAPSLSGAYGLYWFVSMIFAGVFLASQIIKRSARSRRFINRFHHKHREGWSEHNFMLILDTLRTPSKKE